MNICLPAFTVSRTSLDILGRPLLESRSALAAYPLRESNTHNVLHLSVLGRPKWTRTTDLVLIRHAL